MKANDYGRGMGNKGVRFKLGLTEIVPHRGDSPASPLFPLRIKGRIVPVHNRLI
jgi:hypothetical protein